MELKFTDALVNSIGAPTVWREYIVGRGAVLCKSLSKHILSKNAVRMGTGLCEKLSA
jgi:hypothetical protein